MRWLFQKATKDSSSAWSSFPHEKVRQCLYVNEIFINPRRACAEGYSSRLVCMYVCHAHAILAVRAIKSVTKDTVVLNVRFAAILYWRFS